jgi:uncharacterized protein
MLNAGKKNQPKNNWSLRLIGFYQIILSPFFGGNCRFYPSCSCYAHEAFTQYSWPKAFVLSLKRLLKCHPFGPYGYDPLPERKTL